MKEALYADLVKDGIHNDYPPALFSLYSSVYTALYPMYGFRIEDAIPQDAKSAISFTKYLHEHLENTVVALAQLGMSEWDLMELLSLSQNCSEARRNGARDKDLENRLSELKMKVEDTVQDVIKTSPQNTIADSERPIMISATHMHNLAGNIQFLLVDPDIEKSESRQLGGIMNIMQKASAMMRKVPQSNESMLYLSNLLGQGIAEQWAGYFADTVSKRKNYAIAQNKDPLQDPIYNSLISCRSTLLSILGKEEPAEVFNLRSFLKGQLPYLQNLAHKSRQDLHLNIIYDEVRSDDKIPLNVQAVYGQLVILLRNLVHDAIVHGDYEDGLVDIHITLEKPIAYGAAIFSVSNPVWSTPEKLKLLTERLGHERVILDEQGQLIPIPTEETETHHGYHGLGKLYVSQTVEKQLRNAGHNTRDINHMMVEMWSKNQYELSDIKRRRHKNPKREPGPPVNQTIAAWHYLTCNVPVPLHLS